jgi:hypothetical protein
VLALADTCRLAAATTGAITWQNRIRQTIYVLAIHSCR